MQIITTTVYRTLGKDFLTENEAREYEKSYIKEKCKFKIGDVVYFLDTIECKLVKSKITNIILNDLDNNLYVTLEGYEGNILTSDIYLDINLLMHYMRKNMISLIK